MAINKLILTLAFVGRTSLLSLSLSLSLSVPIISFFCATALWVRAIPTYLSSESNVNGQPIGTSYLA